VLGFLWWLLLGTFSGATALVLLLDWAQALADPDPAATEGYTLEVAIGVVAAWVFAFAMYRVVRYLRHHPFG
jgi:hypothetical protein